MAMAGFNSSTFFLICAAVFVVFSCSSTAVHGGLGIQHSLGWIPNQSTCKGTIAECFGGEEFEFDSEISRRILATSQYISYGALRRNTVPCSRRGASYYNCQPGAQANPYSRGCSAITREKRFCKEIEEQERL
ncbi:Protein RALF-like 33, partial [Cucurbita argyrosperma subsp. argyrosperma]